MTILASILPGIRDLRTPLALGYAWIAIGWVCWPRFPQDIDQSEIATRFRGLEKILGNGLFFVTITAIAYALGVVMQLVGILLMAAFRVALYAGAAIFALNVIVFLITRIPGLLVVGFIVAILAGLFHAYSQAVENSRTTASYIDERFFYARTDSSLRQKWREVATPFSAQTERRRRNFLVGHADQMLGDDSVKIKKFLDSLPTFELRRSLQLLLARSAPAIVRISTADRQWDRSQLLGLVKKASSRERRAPVYRQKLIGILHAAMLQNYTYRSWIYERLLGRSNWNAHLDETLGELPTRLQSSQSPIYQEFDRLSSEGELRQQIAVPLGLLLGLSLWDSWSRMARSDISHVLIVSVAVIVAALIQGSGLQKSMESRNLLISTIQIPEFKPVGPPLNSPPDLGMDRTLGEQLPIEMLLARIGLGADSEFLGVRQLLAGLIHKPRPRDFYVANNDAPMDLLLEAHTTVLQILRPSIGYCAIRMPISPLGERVETTESQGQGILFEAAPTADRNRSNPFFVEFDPTNDIDFSLFCSMAPVEGQAEALTKSGEYLYFSFGCRHLWIALTEPEVQGVDSELSAQGHQIRDVLILRPRSTSWRMPWARQTP